MGSNRQPDTWTDGQSGIDRQRGKEKGWVDRMDLAEINERGLRYSLVFYLVTSLFLIVGMKQK